MERRRNNSKKLRLWNQKIMPGWETIAVDERVPEFPKQVIVERGKKRVYQIDESIWDDPLFRRWTRFRIESLIRIEGSSLMSFSEFVGSVNTAVEEDNLSNKKSTYKKSLEVALEDACFYPELLDDLRH